MDICVSALFTRRKIFRLLAPFLAVPLANHGAHAQAQRSNNIGVAYSIGGKGDQSYNDAAAQGTVKLQRRGFNVYEFEPADLGALERGLNLLVQRGAELVICVGFFYDNVIEKVSRRHPTISFVVLDGSVSTTPNVTAIKFNTAQGSFLAGAAAAAQSRNNSVAFIGAMNAPIIDEFGNGFVAGAKFAKPAIDVKLSYVGSDPTGFKDPTRAYQVAMSLITRGADVLYHAAGASGNGIIKAASENKIAAIGVDVDQSHIAPDAVLTSMLKRFDEAMLLVTRQFTENSLRARVTKVGLSESAVGLTPLARFARPEVEPAIQSARTHLIGN
jgi:basic membrane protein A